VYAGLANLLSGSGIQIESSSDPLESADLSGFNAVVLSATSATRVNYSGAEVRALAAFVEDGGGLLFLGENPQFTNRFGVVSEYFGIKLALEPVLDEETRLGEHPILEGVAANNYFGAAAWRPEDGGGDRLGKRPSWPSPARAGRVWRSVTAACSTGAGWRQPTVRHQRVPGLRILIKKIRHG
jgi:hypothetical protein